MQESPTANSGDAKAAAGPENLFRLMQKLRATNPGKAIQYGIHALSLLGKGETSRLEVEVRLLMMMIYKQQGKHDAALAMGRAGKQREKKNEYKEGLANICLNMGLIHGESARYNAALSHYHQALEIWKKLKSENNIAACLNNIGLVYMKVGNYERALGYYLKSLKLLEKGNNSKAKAFTLNDIGALYFDLKNLDRALKYFSRARQIHERLRDKQGLADSFNNIGTVLKERKEYKKALSYFNRALVLEKAITIPAGMATTLNNIGEVYQGMENFKKALNYFKKSLDLSEKINDRAGLASPLLNMSGLSRRTGRPGDALKHAARALGIANALSSKALIMAACKELSDTYAQLRDYESAYRYHLSFKALSDELFNRDNQAKIADIQAKYEIEKREREIKLLKEKESMQFRELDKQLNLNRFYIFTGLVVLLLAFVTFMLYRSKNKAEKTIRHSEEKYRKLVERANDGIAITQGARFRYVNPVLPAMLGYTREELTGMPIVRIVAPEEKIRIKQYYARRMKGEYSPQKYETILIHKDGRKIIASINAGIIFYENRPAAMVIMHDITEQKRSEADRLRKSKLKSIGLLAGGIAHDFNNLLAVILGYLDMVKGCLSPDDHIHKMVTKIEKNALKAKDLAQQFLTFSEGGMPFKKIVSLSPIIKEAVIISHAPDIKHNLKLQDSLFDINCDPLQFKQVCVSLLVNGNEAMGTGTTPDATGAPPAHIGDSSPRAHKGEMLIFAENTSVPAGNPHALNEGDYVRLSVKDQGGGISKENLPRIFDPYFSTKKRVSQQGLGLGLSIVYSIVKKHKGHIEVESKEGEGTTVTVLLPVK
ncbi:MAG: tetratricopeptide repeat protein [bacterium]|nr:tetratricopeptide repeat protein [bacterium]